MRTSAGAKRLLIPIVVAPLLMAAYLSTCGPMTLPECPHDWDFQTILVYNKRAEKLEPLQTLHPSLLSGPQLQTNVPEFNDCQRLIIGSGDTARYDSLYAVFARDSLDDTLDIKGVLDAGWALPMVEILSLGGTYHQLRIEPGLNCLFVFKQSNEWRAKLVAFGSVERDCHSPMKVNDLTVYPDLSIRRTTPGLTWTDYPAVARWEWDVKFNTQVIGFRCLDGWCEVGERGHDPETGPGLTGTMNGIPGLAGTPVLQVKGWYDEQRLSPTTSGWWKPGKGPLSVVGTVVPVPGLDKLDAASFSSWQLIAYVNLSAPSADYDKGQRFVPMTAGKVTTISFCREDWGGPNPLTTGGCPDISLADRKAAKCGPEPATTSQPSTTIHWWAKTIPADNTPPRYWCIVRRSAPKGVPVPGTARWRWLADDETTWGRCGGACCAGH